jgi:hypothetical protein
VETCPRYVCHARVLLASSKISTTGVLLVGRRLSVCPSDAPMSVTADWFPL